MSISERYVKSCRAPAAALGAILIAATPALAQIATSIEQAELAGLSPATLAQVKSRMGQGRQTVTEILQTMLLNNIKATFPGSRIVALDFSRGIAVVQTAAGDTREVNFDTRTLVMKI